MSKALELSQLANNLSVTEGTDTVTLGQANIVLSGNLQVDGTSTTLNTSTLTVDDLNITIADGAASAAAADGAGLTVDGANATLIYKSTPDAWSFNKNLGIGTDAPEQKLHVEGQAIIDGGTGVASAGVLHVRQNGDGSGNGIALTSSNATSHRIWKNANGVLLFGPSSDSDAFAQDLNGNVGIGNSTPTYELDIRGSENGDVGIRINNALDNNGTNDADAAAYLQLSAASNNGYLRLHGAPTDLAADHQFDIGSTAGSAFITFTLQNTERMRVEYGGNVGIGTNAPGEKLDVNGDVRVRGTGSTMAGATIANASLLIGSTTAGIGIDSNEIIAVGDGLYLGSLSGQPPAVFREGTTEYMRINNGGKVGIGTNNPNTRLSVEAYGATGGDNTRVFELRNQSATAYTADALTSYNAHTSYPIVNGATLTYHARGGQAGNLTTHAAGINSEPVLSERIARLATQNTSTALYNRTYYAWDGAGTAISDMNVASTQLLETVGAAGQTGSRYGLYANGNAFFAGKLGIGTNSPSYGLHVYSGTGSDGSVTGGILVENQGNPTGEAAIAFKTQDTGTSSWFTGLNQDNHLAFSYGTSFGDSFCMMNILPTGGVGIGTTDIKAAADGLHVQTGASGGFTANAAHDDVIIEGSGNTGINIFSPNTSYQYLAFGDPQGANSGYVRYYHTDNQMILRADGQDTLYVNNSKVGVGVTPSKTFHVGAGSVLIDNFSGSVGHMTINNATNNVNNNYIRANIMMTRDEDQVLWNPSTNVWDFAGGASTDWSMIAHHSDSLRFYVGSAQGTATTKDMTAFRTDHLALGIKTDGNVGVGTHNPLDKLDVRGNILQIDGSPEYHFGTTNATHYNWRMAVQEAVSGGFEIASGTQVAGTSAPSDTYTNRFVIQASNGNVGISTDTPSNRLEVITSNGNWRINDYGGMNFHNTTDANNERFIHGRSNGVLSIGYVPIANLTGGAGGYGDQTYDQMTILANGDVGIGTTTIGGQLHVFGGLTKLEVQNVPNGVTGSNASALIEATEAQLQIMAVDTGSWASNIVLTNAPASGTNRHWTIHHAPATHPTNPNDLCFRYLATNTVGQIGGDGTGAVSETKMVITSDGKVGIGTNVPGVALDLETPGNTTDGTFYSTFTINNTGTSTWSRIRFDRSGVARWGLALGTDDKFRISNLYTGGTSASPNDNCLVIDNNSDVGIGTGNPTHRLHVLGDEAVRLYSATNGAGVHINFSDHAVGSYAQNGTLEYVHSDTQSFGSGNAFKFFGSETAMTLHVAGDIKATSDVTAYYSDPRLKDFHGTIPDALDKVNSLSGYYFTENARAKELGYTNDSMQVGVNAQEVEEVLPEVVALAAIDDPENYKTVKYDKMVPLLIEAIKELSDKVDAQQQEIERLRNQS